jgi:hypothetical protein
MATRLDKHIVLVLLSLWMVLSLLCVGIKLSQFKILNPGEL